MWKVNVLIMISVRQTKRVCTVLNSRVSGIRTDGEMMMTMWMNLMMDMMMMTQMMMGDDEQI